MLQRDDFVSSIEGARLAAIVENSFDAIISKDLSSVITSWNAAATRMFGYSADEAIGRSVVMLIPEAMRSQERDIIARITRGERLESFETVRLRKDGTPIDVSLTISPIKAPNGAIVGASKIARDITAAREAERKIGILLQEINHRVKNQYAVILSIIRESSSRSSSLAEFEEHVQARILALARSHDLLVSTEWAGASLRDLISGQLSIFGSEDRISLSGPPITLQPNALQYLGMALHELGTNAAKYSSLRTAGGSVAISWEILPGIDGKREFQITWQESNRTPAAPPATSRRGFGRVVLERIVPMSLSGEAEISFGDSGLKWRLRAPYSELLAITGPISSMATGR